MIVEKGGCVGRGEAHFGTLLVDVLAVNSIVVVGVENS